MAAAALAGLALLFGLAYRHTALAGEGVPLLLVFLGLCLGLCASALYHGRLVLALRRRGAAPRRLWWRPARFHGLLRASDRRVVQRFLVLGFWGYFLIMLGLTMLCAGYLY